MIINISFVSGRINKYPTIFIASVFYDDLRHLSLGQTAFFFLILTLIIEYLKIYFPNNFIIYLILYVVSLYVFCFFYDISPQPILIIGSIIIWPIIYALNYFLLTPLEEKQLKFDFTKQ